MSLMQWVILIVAVAAVIALYWWMRRTRDDDPWKKQASRSDTPPDYDQLTGDEVAADAAGSYIVGVGSSRVDLQACKLEYSIVSPK